MRYETWNFYSAKLDDCPTVSLELKVDKGMVTICGYISELNQLELGKPEPILDSYCPRTSSWTSSGYTGQIVCSEEAGIAQLEAYYNRLLSEHERDLPRVNRHRQYIGS